jgi:hypothetical protein
MESDLQRHHHTFNEHQAQHQQNQMNSGLTRYRSAPSSYFSNIIDREFCEQFFSRPTSPDTEQIFARFMSSGSGGGGGAAADGITEDDASEVGAKEGNSQPTQIMQSIQNEAARVLQQQSNFGSTSQSFYQSPSRLPLPNQGLNSMGMDPLTQMKSGGGGNSSSLIRHSSSPAGLFSHINVENSTFLLNFPTLCLFLTFNSLPVSFLSAEHNLVRILSQVTRKILDRFWLLKLRS